MKKMESGPQIGSAVSRSSEADVCVWTDAEVS